MPNFILALVQSLLATKNLTVSEQLCEPGYCLADISTFVRLYILVVGGGPGGFGVMGRPNCPASTDLLTWYRMEGALQRRYRGGCEAAVDEGLD